MKLKAIALATSLLAFNSFAEVNLDAIRKEVVKAFVGEKLKDSPDYYRLSITAGGVSQSSDSTLVLPGLSGQAGEKIKQTSNGDYTIKDWTVIGLMPSSLSCESCDSVSQSFYIIFGRKTDISPTKRAPFATVKETKIAELRSDGAGTQLDIAEYLRGIGLFGISSSGNLHVLGSTGVGARAEIGRTSGPIEVFLRASLRANWKDIVALKVSGEAAYSLFTGDVRRIVEGELLYTLPLNLNRSGLVKSVDVGIQGRSEEIDSEQRQRVDYGGVSAAVEF